LDEDRRSNFQDFLSKYYFNYISYNFLPTEVYNKIKTALDIENELRLLNEKIVAIGLKIQEEQQGRTNVILAIVMVLSTLASIQQIQGDPNLTDDEKIAELNKALHKITELTIETLKYSIGSIRTPNTLVTDVNHIQEFLLNCDRKFYQEIRDHMIELRASTDIQPFDITCPNCSHKWQQTLTLDQAAFFGVAS
jgi:hypothetical protein